MRRVRAEPREAITAAIELGGGDPDDHGDRARAEVESVDTGIVAISFALEDRRHFPDGAEVGAYGPHVPGFEVVRQTGREPLGNPVANRGRGTGRGGVRGPRPGLYQFGAEVAEGEWRTVTARVE